MAQGVESTGKGTMMIGQVMGLTLPRITNLLVTLRPTLQSHPESEKGMGPSGTGTTATDGSNLQPASSLSPCSLCCLCLLPLLLAPCGDSLLLKCDRGVFSVMLSVKHIMKKKSFHLVSPAEM